MFQAKSFSPASFSMQAFKMAQQNEARSGYWRLFFYNMQEEFLNEQKQRKEAEKGTRQVPEKKSVAVVRTPDKRPARDPIVEPLEEPPYLPRLLYRTATVSPVPALQSMLSALRLEVVSWQFTLPILFAQLQAKEAANDEADAIEWLLLAA